MTSTKINVRFQRILEVIDKNNGFATKADFRHSISKYNQSGGTAELDRVLNDMVNQSILFEHRHNARNGQEIKFYRAANTNIDIRASPGQSHSDAHINLSASISFTNEGRGFARELVELFASCINTDKSFVTPANVDSDDIDANDDNISPDDDNGFDTVNDNETPLDLTEIEDSPPVPTDAHDLPF